MAQTEPQFKTGDRGFSHYTKDTYNGISGWGTIIKINHTNRGQRHGVTGQSLPDTTWYDVLTDEGRTEMLDDGHGSHQWNMARVIPPAIAKECGYGDDPRAKHEEVRDHDGNGIVLSSRVYIDGADQFRHIGTVIEISDPDGDVDDDGRSIWTPVQVHVMFDNGEIEPFDCSYVGQPHPDDDGPWEVHDIALLKENN